MVLPRNSVLILYTWKLFRNSCDRHMKIDVLMGFAETCIKDKDIKTVKFGESSCPWTKVTFFFKQFFLLIAGLNLRLEENYLGKLEITKGRSRLLVNSFFRALIFGEDNVYTCLVKEGRDYIECTSPVCVRGVLMKTRVKGQLVLSWVRMLKAVSLNSNI